MKWVDEFWSTETGKRVFNSWRTIRRVGCVPEWQDINVFLKWALDSGVEDSIGVDRIHRDMPYGPDNCSWRKNKDDCGHITVEFIKKWDRAVNRIRAYYGMEPVGVGCNGCCHSLVCKYKTDDVTTCEHYQK